MSIDPTALANLLADEAAGQKIACAHILKVTWAAGVIRYYSGAAFQSPPFLGSGLTVEPRLLFSDKDDPFFQYEKNPDLRSSTIKVSFDDIDHSIKTLFQTYRSGVNCEIFLWYPKYNILTSEWFGQLVAPQVYGISRIDTVISNGFRSPEQLLPGRPPQPDFCTANFGRLLPNLDAVRSNGCRYDRHLGGTLGAYKTGTTPYSDCPKTKAACNLRFATSVPRYWLGFDVSASAVATDGHSGYLAVSKGNETALGAPIRIIAGMKHVRSMQPIQGRPEDNSSDHSKGFFRAVYLIGEGPISQFYNLFIKDKYIEQINQDLRWGTIAQGSCNYAPDISNYSLTAHISAAYGWVDARTVTVKDFQAEGDCIGYCDVYSPFDIAAGAGLVGKYYADVSTTTEIARKVDLTLNFPSSQNPPVVGERMEIGFEIVWTGFITFPATETVTLQTLALEADDFVNVNVNGSSIFSATYPSAGSGTFAATAGVPYPITVTYHNNGTGGVVSYNPWGLILRWHSTSLGSTPVVIPSTAFSHGADSGFIRQWTDDRVWWLLECYKNQRWGMAYDLSRFNITEIKTTSIWSRNTVQYIHTFPDGETQDLSGRRTAFNAIMEGRPYKDQIVDICAPANIAVPFQNDGLYTIRPIRTYTAGELSAAPVFSDRGQSRKVIWDGKLPMLSFAQIPDDKLFNTIKVTFEDVAHQDAERQIIVDEPAQKLLAGKSLGDGMLKEVSTNLSAFGVNSVAEAVRYGRRALKFGNPSGDAGSAQATGTENNLWATVTAPMEYFLNHVRYDCIVIDSEELDGFTIGTGSTTETPTYFRIWKMNKIAKGGITAVCQVYNRTAMEAFEVVTATPPALPDSAPTSPIAPIPQPCIPTIGGGTGYNSTDGILSVEVIC
jgi:hypothetical protein